ncbi:MAG TPA: 2-amino-4-hydroxy-6-hydroxymethyldihydropteridine diphosphokinase [Anaerolineaceae bacterium]
MPCLHRVYIAMGTNLGDRAANLEKAIALLPPDAQPMRLSPIYETEPWGYTDQPAFLNAVLEAETSLPPLDLLAALKRIESEIGRKPTFRYGPRLIDLDILFYDDLILEADNLVIPHPRLAERLFVLQPLADLAPDLRHPVSGLTIDELLHQILM